MERLLESLSRKDLPDILYVRQCVSYVIRHQLGMKHFIEMPNTMFSPCVDPLAHDFEKTPLNYYDQQVYPVTSLIFHKMAVLGVNKGFNQIFWCSPNLRKELQTKNGRYSTEFTQMDFEWRGSFDETINLIKSLLSGIHFVLNLNEKIKKIIFDRTGEELKQFSPEEVQVIDSTEFPEDLPDEKMHQYLLTEKNRDLNGIPFILTNLKREAYDRFEDGKYLNYDVIYPSYGEVLSGGAREWEYSRLKERMEELNYNLDEFEAILELAKNGNTSWSCGGGFGVERLTRALLHLDDVNDCLAFPRIPGEQIVM